MHSIGKFATNIIADSDNGVAAETASVLNYRGKFGRKKKSCAADKVELTRAGGMAYLIAARNSCGNIGGNQRTMCYANISVH